MKDSAELSYNLEHTKTERLRKHQLKEKQLRCILQTQKTGICVPSHARETNQDYNVDTLPHKNIENQNSSISFEATKRSNQTNNSLHETSRSNL